MFPFAFLCLLYAGNVRDACLILGSGTPPGGGQGNSSILAWRTPWIEEPGRQTMVRGVTRSQTGLKWLSMHACIMKLFTLSFSIQFLFYNLKFINQEVLWSILCRYHSFNPHSLQLPGGHIISIYLYVLSMITKCSTNMKYRHITSRCQRMHL